MTVKVCIKCGEEKTIDLFSKGKRYKDGRRNTCKKCHTEYMIDYYKNNPQKNLEKIRLNNKNRPQWKRHGMSENEWNLLYHKYDGKCHSCKENDGVAIDHDHSCCSKSYSCGNCIRGFLCRECNISLGIMKEEYERIIKLAEYINPAWPTGKATNC